MPPVSAGHLTKSGNIFDCHSGRNGVEGAVSIWWTASREAAAKHPTMHRTVPASTKYPGQKGNNAKAEKLWYILITVRWYNGNEAIFTVVNEV